jgi:integrase
MIDYAFNGVKVSLVRKVKSNSNDEKQPIYWRLTFQRKQKYYFTGNKYDESEWHDFTNRSLKKDYKTKQALTNYFEKTLKPIIEELVINSSFSFEKLDSILFGFIESTISVNKAFEIKIKLLESENRIGSVSTYKSTLNSLMRFKHYKLLKKKAEKREFIKLCIERKNITIGDKVLRFEVEINFEEITTKFLEECEQFWFDTEMSPTSMGIYMRTLRAVINNAEGDKPYIDQVNYPFGIKRGKYAIPDGGRREIALPIEQIWKIENYETDNSSIELARDIFVFMFYCNGLNFGDLCRLTYDNINAPSKEIIFQRKKTLRKTEKPDFIYVPIIPPILEIINRQGNKSQDGYIFPFLNGVEPIMSNERKIKREISLKLALINSSLKYIVDELELDPEITTSYTRNSYITHLTSELLINPIVVKKMVGHSTKKDVTAGYVKLTPKKRREINMKLVNPERKYNTINSKVTTG